MIIDITQMKPEESGRIADIQGGENFLNKVRGMGIRPDKKITKISSHFWCGPQTIKVDNHHVAIGFGMAKKILVDVKR